MSSDNGKMFLEWVNWIDESIKKSEKLFYKSIEHMPHQVWHEITEHVKQWNSSYSKERNFQISIEHKYEINLCRLIITKNVEEPKEKGEVYLPHVVQVYINSTIHDLIFKEVQCKEKRPIVLSQLPGYRFSFKWGPITCTVGFRVSLLGKIQLDVSHTNNEKKNNQVYERQLDTSPFNEVEIYTVHDEILRITTLPRDY